MPITTKAPSHSSVSISSRTIGTSTTAPTIKPVPVSATARLRRRTNQREVRAMNGTKKTNVRKKPFKPMKRYHCHCESVTERST